MLVLYLHGHTDPPTANRWDKIRYLNVRNQLLQLYKAPRNFLRAAITQADRVPPVPAPPANGRTGYSSTIFLKLETSFHQTAFILILILYSITHNFNPHSSIL